MAENLMQALLLPLFLAATLLSNGAQARAEKKPAQRPIPAGARVVAIEYDGSAEDFAPVRKMQSLRHVSLVNGRIEKAHIDHLVALEQLESVTLSDTYASGDWFEALSKLPKLRKLEVGFHNFPKDADLQKIGKLKELRVLIVSEVVSAHDGWLVCLETLTYLRDLDLGRMSITDKGAELISKSKSIETLDLCETQITDKALKHLEAMPKLRYVSVNDTEVTEAGVIAFQKLRPEVTVRFEGELYIKGRRVE
ncbi:hypothetical protein AYO40_02220 [Planctomycetaceae bacterium SCGC AG-212-D15]|nr:hypothetical protein AYO40_02220 [Planctomycetaceae bacterium SCGC AG-212-D15]